PARPLLLPVLRRARRPHLRPSDAALARRAHDLGQRRSGVLALQPAQGQPDSGRGAHVAIADAVPAHGASSAQERAAVSAELPAPKLARLSLLGHRTRALSPAPSRDKAASSP